ncbi:MAG: hypothetical protein MUO62_04160 [Anaerolineales bacterium]|nr:hypothetical protein [Anaerolineales bacterium]
MRFRLNAITNLFTPNHAAGIIWAESLPRISCPVLMLMADLGKVAWRAPAGVAARRALVPQLQTEHVVHTGHSIQGEQFGPYLEDGRAFLAGEFMNGIIYDQRLVCTGNVLRICD